jgi:hypothetical protein
VPLTTLKAAELVYWFGRKSLNGIKEVLSSWAAAGDGYPRLAA